MIPGVHEAGGELVIVTVEAGGALTSTQRWYELPTAGCAAFIAEVPQQGIVPVYLVVAANARDTELAWRWGWFQAPPRAHTPQTLAFMVSRGVEVSDEQDVCGGRGESATLGHAILCVERSYSHHVLERAKAATRS